jgi:hypothetical protein
MKFVMNLSIYVRVDAWFDVGSLGGFITAVSTCWLRSGSGSGSAHGPSTM